MFPSRYLFLAVNLLTIGCSGMGDPCDGSNDCSGDGTCLKGVCSGYSCDKDADCDNDLVCGKVNGVNACVVPCTSDDDCEGEQTCLDVLESLDEGAESNEYCM